MTKKKFAELELSLLHLQQNVEIPETHLIIHPIIQRTVEQARAAGNRPSLSDIPPKLLNDSTFLNTLHSHVNQWIKSIQAVTKLTRDVASGTASQEINFWLSLERALEGIENQLRSDEVNTVMDCLRNAKRFRATVSFIADTGLKDATDTGTHPPFLLYVLYQPVHHSPQIQSTYEGFPSKRAAFCYRSRQDTGVNHSDLRPSEPQTEAFSISHPPCPPSRRGHLS
jgi:hypothetical protein